MQLGDWQLDTAQGGRFKLDGGAMHGVVPKPVWQKGAPADERNRIQLATNCVLARRDGLTLLLETGCGSKHDERSRDRYDLAAGNPLFESLARHSVSPDEIDIVLFGHLHFDHSGGATILDAAGKIVPAFPNATIIAGRQEWSDAIGGRPELRGMYVAEELLPLAESGKLRLVDDGDTIVPGLTALHTGGHTAGHLLLKFESRGEAAIYAGDICPTAGHMRMQWNMAYDTFPLDTRTQKPRWLGRAADEDWLVLWNHDPHHAAARIARHADKEFVVAEAFDEL